tara:strand:- start:416 stop:580 length:165 start_codon:yes stop_codon:yes gene_type:complete
MNWWWLVYLFLIWLWCWMTIPAPYWGLPEEEFTGEQAEGEHNHFASAMFLEVHD